MFHFDCYFNVLILMGPSCRNPWAHFQFYRNAELIIMEAYNLRAGMTFVVIRSSSDILQVSKGWMISSRPSTEYWSLAPQLRPVTVNPLLISLQMGVPLLYSESPNHSVLLLTLHYILVAFGCEVGGLGTLSDSLLYILDRFWLCGL